MKVWVARSSLLNGGYYRFFKGRPTLQKANWDVEPDFYTGTNPEDKDSDAFHRACAEEFERVTGFKLKPGTCRRVDIIVVPVGPVRK